MITKIITHNRPHVDELVALMLLRRFREGEQEFPGVATAEISFLTTGELPQGKTAKDFPDTIFLGCGGGEFDEHATSQKERVVGECCATLVAKKLGIENNHGLQKILTFVKSEDLKGTKVKNELPMIVKFLHACYQGKDMEIAKWVEDAYFGEYEFENQKWQELKDLPDAIIKWKESKGVWQRPTLESSTAMLRSQNYKDLDWWINFAEHAIKFQNERFIDAGKEFEQKGIVEIVPGPHGKPVKLGVVTSDNEEINKYARSTGVDVVVQFSTKGNVSIMTRRPAQIDLTFAFVLLRMAEQHYRGGIKTKDEKILSKEGAVEGIPEWYLGRSHDIGFNGSMTATEIEPTKIPHTKLVNIIKEGIKVR